MNHDSNPYRQFCFGIEYGLLEEVQSGVRALIRDVAAKDHDPGAHEFLHAAIRFVASPTLRGLAKLHRQAQCRAAVYRTKRERFAEMEAAPETGVETVSLAAPGAAAE